MTKFFKSIYFWCYIKIHMILINISIALYNSEHDILKADPNNLSEADKKTTRMLHRNPLLEKFYAGTRDEKYMKDYYELLEKADKFMRTASSHKMAVASDKYGMSYGQKDKFGRTYEHYTFFDDKHKHAGKTLGEVLDIEMEERRLKDDDYELLYIYDNKPIEVGLANIMDVLEKNEGENAEFEYKVVDVFKKSKQFKFPISALRKNKDAVNKIEQLTEFLHVKKIGFEYRILEFYIPLKFRTSDVPEDSAIYKELLDITEIFINDKYGKLKGFGIIEFMKRVNYNNTHEVWKFEGIEMDTMGQQ